MNKVYKGLLHGAFYLSMILLTSAMFIFFVSLFFVNQKMQGVAIGYFIIGFTFFIIAAGFHYNNERRRRGKIIKKIRRK